MPIGTRNTPIGIKGGIPPIDRSVAQTNGPVYKGGGPVGHTKTLSERQRILRAFKQRAKRRGSATPRLTCGPPGARARVIPNQPSRHPLPTKIVAGQRRPATFDAYRRRPEGQTTVPIGIKGGH